MAQTIDNKVKQPQRVGSGFTNLQRVIGANTGSRLGQAVGSGVQQQAQQVREGAQQGLQQFQQKSDQNRLGTEQHKEKVQQVIGNIGGIEQKQIANQYAPQQPQVSTQQPQATPQQVPIGTAQQLPPVTNQAYAPTDEDIAQFSQFRSGLYQGPQNVDNIEELKAQAAEAEELGGMGSSQGGRMALAQRFAAKPASQYGFGQQNLDALLLGTLGGKQLQQARKQALGTFSDVGRKEQVAQGIAGQNTGLAKKFGEDVSGQLGTLGSAYTSEAERRAAQAADVEKDIQNKAGEYAKRASESGELTEEAMRELGVWDDQRFFGVDPGAFMKYQAGSNTAGTSPEAAAMLDPAEQAKFANLQKLLGKKAEDLGYSADKAGQFKQGKIGYDAGAFQEARRQKEGEYNQKKDAVDKGYDFTRWAKGDLDPVETGKAIEQLRKEGTSEKAIQNILEEKQRFPNSPILGQAMWRIYTDGKQPPLRGDWAAAAYESAKKGMDDWNTQNGVKTAKRVQ